MERQGFSFWLNGTFSQPPLSDDATRHFTWNINNASLCRFIRQYISIADRNDVADLKSSAQIFAFLSNGYIALGTWAQCNGLADLWNILFCNGTSMEETIHKKVSAMGPINWGKIKAIALVNALSGDFEYLQSSIQQKVEDPNFTSRTVLKCIRHEANLIKRRAEQHPTVPSVSSTALVVQTKTRQRPFCKNCRCPGHSANFCIAPGGKFAGHTIEEAIAVQRAVLGLPPRNATSQVPSTGTTANVAMSDASLLPTPLGNSFVINGITYTASPAPTPAATMTDATTSALTTETYNTNFEFSSFLAMNGAPSASVDWDVYSRPFDTTQAEVSPVAYSTSRVPVLHLPDIPFILDSGASFHISPERSDFKSL
jgi:hypothetical protein